MSDEVTNPLGIYFEHEWQRDAWEAEIRAMRAKTKQDRISEAGKQAIDIPALIGQLRPTIVPNANHECSAAPYDSAAQRECCDRVMHYAPGRNGLEVTGRCPALRRAEVRELVARERKRLAGEIALAEESGPLTWAGYQADRCKEGVAALAAAIEFASGRPPQRNVFLAGTTGLAKTRLLLTSHFALLEAGIRSIYVTSPELRQAFVDIGSFDDEIKDQGTRFVERLPRAQALHIDDLGNVENDERRRGVFAEGLKQVLDRSPGKKFAATNLTWDAATKHPDVGDKVLSRLVSGAIVVKLDGEDYRVAHSERRR